jgi:hypothetical protein
MSRFRAAPGIATAASPTDRDSGVGAPVADGGRISSRFLWILGVALAGCASDQSTCSQSIASYCANTSLPCPMTWTAAQDRPNRHERREYGALAIVQT